MYICQLCKMAYHKPDIHLLYECKMTSKYHKNKLININKIKNKEIIPNYTITKLLNLIYDLNDNKILFNCNKIESELYNECE